MQKRIKLICRPSELHDIGGRPNVNDLASKNLCRALHFIALSRLTVTTTGDDLKVEQVTKQLNKIIDVVKVVDLTEGAHVERDTLLVKVRAEGEQRDEVKRTTEIFRGQIIDVGPTTYIVQLTGPADKLDSFLEALGETQVLEVVRSGVAGMARGEKVLSP